MTTTNSPIAIDELRRWTRDHAKPDIPESLLARAREVDARVEKIRKEQSNYSRESVTAAFAQKHAEAARRVGTGEAEPAEILALNLASELSDAKDRYAALDDAIRVATVPTREIVQEAAGIIARSFGELAERVEREERARFAQYSETYVPSSISRKALVAKQHAEAIATGVSTEPHLAPPKAHLGRFLEY